MPRVVFIADDGTRREVEAPVGESVMRAAILNNVPGIDADCGGECACATCHVFVEPEWLDRAGQRSEMEDSMLGFAATVQANSRLSCQIKLTEALDGLVVRTPHAQH